MSLGHAVSGSLGTAISTFAVYPLDLVNTRLKVQHQLRSNAQGERYRSIPDAFRKIYAQEGGVTAFFAGARADLLKSAVDSFLFFLFYTYLRAWLRLRRRQRGIKNRALSPLHEIAVGTLAGASSRLFTTPIANVVTRRQTAGVGQQRQGESFWETLAEIRQEKGSIRGLWAGYSATLVLTLNPSITFFLQDALMTMAAGNNLEDDAGPGFLIAATSKAIATAVTYPFQTAKSRVQAAPRLAEETGEDDTLIEANAKAEKHWAEVAPNHHLYTIISGIHSLVKHNIFATVFRIARREGVWALFAGIGGELLKAFFSHGLTMVSKGFAHRFILQLYFTIVASLKRYHALRSQLGHTPGRDTLRQIFFGHTLKAARVGERQPRLDD
ncbi:mitochondrial carrier [Thozetella sp. PMI_491]|nr:mitochondrial carrier [Thozetella sp. PMI_491]